VELNLFGPMYEDKQWFLSPMNAVNNVNGVGAIGRNDVHTLDKNAACSPSRTNGAQDCRGITRRG
jgi:hypothetical protein